MSIVVYIKKKKTRQITIYCIISYGVIFFYVLLRKSDTYFWLFDNGLNVIVYTKVRQPLKIVEIKAILYICGIGFYYY